MSYRSLPIGQSSPGPIAVGESEAAAWDVEPEDAPTWRDKASCRGLDIAAFFPVEGDAAAIARAKDVCADCPVRADCLSYAVEHNQTEGIWGGTTRQERRKLRRLWLKDLSDVG